MIVMPRTIFFHIPKTGGRWVREVIKNAGIYSRAYDQNFGHNIPFNCTDTFRIRFCFVRNPIDWYRSFWSYRMRTGWQNSVIDECQSPIFEEFVTLALKRSPAHVTQMYEMFIGTEDNPQIQWVGKQENLVNDLIDFLHKAGERFNEETIRATPAINTAGKFPAEYPQWLREKVAEVEHEAMKRFQYEV